MVALPNMLLVTPTPNGDSGTWDDKINACFGLIDAHDHTSSKGVRITPAAINVNADLPMGGFALTALGKIVFSEIAALSAGADILFVNSADHELYWRTHAGANVKLTNGASINTSLVGGIVGDYAATGAEVAYDDTNKRYTFKDGTSPTKKWVRMAHGPVRLYEHQTTVANYVELISPSALAASYTVKFAAALPAAQVLVQIAADGSLVYSNSIANNTDITLQGTGHIKHGDYTEVHPIRAAGWFGISGSAPAYSGSSVPTVVVPNSSENAYAIDLGNNKRRVKAVTIYARCLGTGDTTFKLYATSGITTATESFNALTLTGATTGTTLVVSPSGTYDAVTLTLTTPETLPQGGEQLLFYVSPGGGSGTCSIVGYSVTFDITT